MDRRTLAEDKYFFTMKYIKLSVLCVAVFMLCSCGGGAKRKPVVTVSIQPQQYFLENIVGDKVDVKCLLANGGNPETFEPSMTHLMSLENSVAYFMIGNVGFENAVIERVRKNNPDLKIYDNSEGVELLIGTHGDCHHHHHDHGNSCSAAVDPHTWSSVKNARVIVRNMYEAMLEIDAENADYYKSRYDRIDARLDSIDRLFTERLAAKKGVAFLVWHPSLSYFAKDYGLMQISIGSEGKESSVQQLQSKIEEAKKHNAKIFFFQQEFDSRQASVVNEQIGAEMVTINPLDYQWDYQMMIIADAIASK